LFQRFDALDAEIRKWKEQDDYHSPKQKLERLEKLIVNLKKTNKSKVSIPHNCMCFFPNLNDNSNSKKTMIR